MSPLGPTSLKVNEGKILNNFIVLFLMSPLGPTFIFFPFGQFKIIVFK